MLFFTIVTSQDTMESVSTMEVPQLPTAGAATASIISKELPER